MTELDRMSATIEALTAEVEALREDYAAMLRLHNTTAAAKRKRAKWVSVNDFLPEPKTGVLVAFDDGEVWVLWQDWVDVVDVEAGAFDYPKDPEWREWHTATHWMPLPEPPRRAE